MRFIFLVMLSLSGWFTSLQANNYPSRVEGSFTHWHHKRLDLISLFLPSNPVIIQAGDHYGNEIISFSQHWPNAKIISFEPNPHALDEWCYENQVDPVDFLYLNLWGAELQVLKSSPEVLKSVGCIAVHTNLFPFRIGTTQYVDLKSFLEKSGFQLLTHWYREGLEGDAIFVKRDYFLNDATQEYLDNHRIDGKYQRYYEPFFKTYYDLDDDEDSIKKTLKQGYPYEGNIGVILEELITPGSLVLDIGSHIGLHTVTMSRKTAPQGAVIAFEPNSKFYMELLNTLKINQCNNVLPICKALSDASGQALLSTDFHPCPQIVRPDDNCSLAYQTNKNATGELVEVITLDSLNLQNLSLIKMDVENYEYFILKGAEKTIKRNKPVIVFECWIGADYNNSNPKEKANFDRVMALMESYGYEVHVIYCNDFIAFPTEATGKLAEYKKRFKKLDLNNFDLGL